MKVESLIDQLVKEAAPVRRTFDPLVHLLFLTILSLASLFFFVRWYGLGQNFIPLLTDPWFDFELCLMIATAIISGYAAISLSYPGLGSVSLVTGADVLWKIWGSLLIVELGIGFANSGRIETEQLHGASCALGTVIYASIPFAYLMWVSTSTFPVMPRHTAGLIALSSATFASVGVRMCCSSSAPFHLFVWHFLPVLALTYCAALFGPRFLRPQSGRKG